MSAATLTTKSIRLNVHEKDMLKQISHAENVSEAAILKRFVIRGMSRFQLEQAITAYERGEADLSAAARYARVSVYYMMTELQKRKITPPAAAEKFMAGLQTLVDTFGGSDALQQTIAGVEET